MIRPLLVLLALPFGSLVAQASVVRIAITSPAQAAFRIVRFERDSAERPLIAHGRVEIAAEAPSARGIAMFQGMEVTSLDSISRVHVDATLDGRVIASGDGVYLTIHRDTLGVAIEARSNVPPAIIRTLRRPE